MSTNLALCGHHKGLNLSFNLCMVWAIMTGHGRTQLDDSVSSYFLVHWLSLFAFAYLDTLGERQQNAMNKTNVFKSSHWIHMHLASSSHSATYIHTWPHMQLQYTPTSILPSDSLISQEADLTCSFIYLTSSNKSICQVVSLPCTWMLRIAQIPHSYASWSKSKSAWICHPWRSYSTLICW